MFTSRTSPVWFVASLALAGCAGGTPAARESASYVPETPGTPTSPPNVTGASVEGVVERRAGDGSPATHLLRGDHGEVVALLENATPLGHRELALGLHEGQRVNVTGSVTGRADGVPVVSAGSLVVLRGGDFDRVIAVLTQFRCPGVTFAESDVYRLDALHSTRDERFPVHVQANGKAYTVWVRRGPEASAGYAVDQVLRNEGKVLAPACPNGEGSP
ncbi:hypothetical protein [Polyangium sp. 6x1]|uniref:hypothetical protein n=1 Tax=Polyangium sp. 6x1 TaxID=3042689 RepID=UPI0024826B9B|nr:hypothetical protein [Polyangium sp. 6x1]MDI1451695.1 hypothetical protein [Polyangium sp. 6x1]